MDIFHVPLHVSWIFLDVSHVFFDVFWLVVEPYPSEKYEVVSWDHYSQYVQK